MNLGQFLRLLRRTMRARAIVASGLLDRNWYLDTYPDVQKSGASPEIHYLEHGAEEGRDPNPVFDTRWYLQQNPDVLAAGVNPLVHYLEHGAAEGRHPSPRFDSDRYMERNPEVRAAGLNPLIHYMRRSTRHEQTLLPWPSADAARLPTSSLRSPCASRPRVLIVGSTAIPQCARYRVWQRKHQLEALGIDCDVVDSTRVELARTALQAHSIAIFYRVPALAAQLALIAEAKRLGVPTFWEVDDLIFDLDAYRSNRNIDRLDPELRNSVLDDAKLHRAALRACGRGIASTRVLADAMRRAGARSVHVIENALDAEMLDLARSARTGRALPGAKDATTIAYGSGSNVHDVDFECAAAGLRSVMLDRPAIRLCVIGDVILPSSFADLGNRVERLPFMNYRTYMATLGRAHISLAPLEATRFNDAKSNIKYIEASILELPSVCSPRDPFRQVIEHGINGFLAETDDQWREALTSLVDDVQLRNRIGSAALGTVMKQYAPDVVTRTQVAAFVEDACRLIARTL